MQESSYASVQFGPYALGVVIEYSVKESLAPLPAVTDRDRKALQCALLLAQDPTLSQEAIANRLELGPKGQGEVSKLLKHARDRGWLRWSFHWPPQIPTDERVRLERETGFQQLDELHKKVKGWTVENPLTGMPTMKSDGIHVVELPADANGPSRPFGMRAAEVVVRLLHEARTCAVAWGRTVESVVEAVPLQPPAPERQFLPICGEPLNYRSDFSPSVAAAMLARAYQVPGSNLRSLQGVPARVPADMAQWVHVIKEFASRSKDYRAIFGRADSPNAPIASVDMVLTGAGSALGSAGEPWYQEATECEPELNLENVSVGNIGGVWLPRPGISEESRQLLDQANSRWLGISIKHFTNVARRATWEHTPGVVLVAADADKREIVRAALPLVNHLIISRELAETLLEPGFS